MSDYAYTYPDRTDEKGFEALTPAQQQLGKRINAVARVHGNDRRDLLIAATAPSADKAALAEVWGGAGAGDEFRR